MGEGRRSHALMGWAASLALVTTCAVLSACGGGGGGGTTPASNQQQPSSQVDSANQADGLGDRGEAPGTVALGKVATNGIRSGTPLVAVALNDNGSAMAAWGVGNDPSSTAGDTVAWSVGGSNGTWSPAATLSQVGTDAYHWMGLALRTNAAGNFLLGWGRFLDFSRPHPLRAIRYLNGSWESGPYNLANGTKDPLQTAEEWDLALLTDDSIVSGATIYNASTDRYIQSVVRVDSAGATTLPVQADPVGGFDSEQYTFFAPLANGSGLFVYSAPLLPTSNLQVYARLASAISGPFAPFPIGTYTGSFCAPLVGATSASGRTALAIVPAGCTELHLVNVDVQSSIVVGDQQVIPAGASVATASKPVVAVDGSGNALAIWSQSNGTGDALLMWSSAAPGGSWSTPQPLIANLSALGQLGRSMQIHLSMRMNEAGQALAAVRLDKDVSGASNPSIVVARYTPSGGWQTWHTIANKWVLSEPSVAINASGAAVVTYWGHDTLRRLGKPGPYAGDGSVAVKAFALRF